MIPKALKNKKNVLAILPFSILPCLPVAYPSQKLSAKKAEKGFVLNPLRTKDWWGMYVKASKQIIAHLSIKTLTSILTIPSL